MAGTLTLTKILDVRENEKKIAEKEYHQSMNIFEVVATDFYTLLKKKETAEASYDNLIQSTVSIEQVKQQSKYIETLNNKIVDVQKRVNHARNDMTLKQSKLSEAHIEVKKFEKIIEHRIKAEDEIKKKIELASMDEISITQYLSRK